MINYIEENLKSQNKKITRNQTEKEQAFEDWYAQKDQAQQQIRANINSGLVAHYPFDAFLQKTKTSYLSPSGIVDQNQPPLSEPIIGAGHQEKGLFINEFTQMKLPEKVGWFDQTDPFTLSFSVYHRHKTGKQLFLAMQSKFDLG